MPDLYVFLGGFMVSLALIGFAFTAGRNYEKRHRRLIAQWSDPRYETGR